MKLLEKTKQGFSLVELIIVIVVIGILASIVIVAYGSGKADSIRRSLQVDAQNWHDAIKGQIAANSSCGAFISDKNNPPDFKLSANNAISVTTSFDTTCVTYTATLSNPAISDVYLITVGADSDTGVPILRPNPYILTPGVDDTNTGTGTVYSGGPYGYGLDIFLSTAGGGTPTPTYQWQVYSIKNAKTGGTWSNIAGATSATYTYHANSAQPSSQTFNGITIYGGDYLYFKVIYTSGSSSTSRTQYYYFDSFCTC